MYPPCTPEKCTGCTLFKTRCAVSGTPVFSPRIHPIVHRSYTRVHPSTPENTRDTPWFFHVGCTIPSGVYGVYEFSLPLVQALYTPCTPEKCTGCTLFKTRCAVSGTPGIHLNTPHYTPVMYIGPPPVYTRDTPGIHPAHTQVHPEFTTDKQQVGASKQVVRCTLTLCLESGGCHKRCLTIRRKIAVIVIVSIVEVFCRFYMGTRYLCTLRIESAWTEGRTRRSLGCNHPKNTSCRFYVNDISC